MPKKRFTEDLIAVASLQAKAGMKVAGSWRKMTACCVRAPRAVRAVSIAFAFLVAVALPAADDFLESELGFRHRASPTSQKYLPEAMSGGVALLDYDQDGRLDIFRVNGAALADPMPSGAAPDKSDPAYWNRLYRNLGDGRWEDVTAGAGVAGRDYGQGAAAGDIDGDGYPDLYVTNYGPDILYRNRGDGSFEDVSSPVGIVGDGWSAGAASSTTTMTAISICSSRATSIGPSRRTAGAATPLERSAHTAIRATSMPGMRGAIAELQAADGQYEEAAESYRQELELSPHIPTVHYRYAVVLQQLARTGEAAEHLQQAVDGDPRIVDAWAQLGKALLQEKDFSRAEQAPAQGAVDGVHARCCAHCPLPTGPALSTIRRPGEVQTPPGGVPEAA